MRGAENESWLLVEFRRPQVSGLGPKKKQQWRLWSCPECRFYQYCSQERIKCIIQFNCLLSSLFCSEWRQRERQRQRWWRQSNAIHRLWLSFLSRLVWVFLTISSRSSFFIFFYGRVVRAGHYPPTVARDRHKRLLLLELARASLADLIMLIPNPVLLRFHIFIWMGHCHLERPMMFCCGRQGRERAGHPHPPSVTWKKKEWSMLSLGGGGFSICFCCRPPASRSSSLFSLTLCLCCLLG